MTERQIDIMTHLSAWQRAIGFAQGVLDGVENPVAKRAIGALDTTACQIYSFMLDMMMTKDGDSE